MHSKMSGLAKFDQFLFAVLSTFGSMIVIWKV